MNDRKRWVALATDVNPHYAVYAPIVVRLWERLGYEPILVRHNEGWDSPLGELVVSELYRNGEGVRTIETPRIEPLSVGNTMRVSRLAAAAWPEVGADDLVLTADIDMAPLHRSWFNQPWRMFVARADMYGSLAGAVPLLHDGKPALICGLFRFPLCYVGLPASVWCEILPLVPGDVIRSIRRVLHGLRHDQVDYDEATCSARLLLSHRAVGDLRKLETYSELVYQQGELILIPSTRWPEGTPERMLIHGQAHPSRLVESMRANVVDFHMPRPAARWIDRAISFFWPEEADWIADYWARVSRVTSLGD